MKVRSKAMVLLVVAMLLAAPVGSAAGPAVEGDAGWWERVEGWFGGLAGWWVGQGWVAGSSAGNSSNGNDGDLEPPDGELSGWTDPDGVPDDGSDAELGPWTDPNG